MKNQVDDDAFVLGPDDARIGFLVVVGEYPVGERSRCQFHLLNGVFFQQCSSEFPPQGHGVDGDIGDLGRRGLFFLRRFFVDLLDLVLKLADFALAVQHPDLHVEVPHLAGLDVL